MPLFLFSFHSALDRFPIPLLFRWFEANLEAINIFLIYLFFKYETDLRNETPNHTIT